MGSTTSRLVADARSRYDRYVLSHSDRVATAEALARLLSFVITGRFEGSQLLAEFIYATTGLAGIYNDQLLFRQTQLLGQANMASASWYASFWTRKSPVYRQLAVALTALGTVQVLLEMLLIRLVGHKRKWKFIFVIEVIRFLLKVWLFKVTSDRMVLKQLLPEMKREISPFALSAMMDPNSTAATEHSQTMNGKHNDDTDADADAPSLWRGSRSGATYPTVASIRQSVKGNDNSVTLNFLSRNALQSSLSPFKFLEELSKDSEQARYVAEWLHLIRPVVYVAAIIKFGRSSWKSWAISLLIDLVALRLVFRHLPNVSPTEKEEYGVRRLQLLYHLARSPFYDAVTKKVLDAVIDAYGWIPLISIGTNALKDQMKLAEELYFYTSASGN